MFKFIGKHRLFFDSVAAIFFGLGSYSSFSGYFISEYENASKRGMDLFGGIVFAIMVIIKLTDVVGLLGNKKGE